MTRLFDIVSSPAQAPTQRAATTLLPALQAAGAAQAVWRGNEWLQADARPDATSSGFAALDRELPGQGWPQGQLVELLAERGSHAELGLLAPALAAVSRAAGTCVWVLPCSAGAAAATPAALPYAPALQQAGIDLARNIFVQPLTPRESGWALEESLRAAHLGALVGWLPEGGSTEADFRCLRRLHLLAQRHRALVFLVRAARHVAAPSPAPLRLQLQHDGGQLQLRLLKRRGRPLLEPIALQIHPQHWNRAPEPAAAPTPVPARPARTAMPTAASLLQMVRGLRPDADWALQALPGGA
jgi:hypothetical protein